MDPRDELRLAFDEFTDSVLELLADAHIPAPTSPAEIATGILMGKILRLADAALVLAHGRHPNDTGPTLRALLSCYVNLKFIGTHWTPNAPALRYISHLVKVRARMRPLVVRPDRTDEGFPVMTAKAWAADDLVVRRQMDALRKWSSDNKVSEMASLAPRRKWWRFWRRYGDAGTWTGLSDAALFKRVGERDSYRFYSFFSNELHGNIGGLGEVATTLSDGRIDINDDGPIAAPLILASKYLILSIGVYRDCLRLPIDDAAIQTVTDKFAEAFSRYRAVVPP